MYSRWRKDGSRFHLGRMTLGELCRAYASHPAVHLYLVLALVTGVYAGLHAPAGWRILLPIAATILAYPLAWYLIHRFILHGRWLYRSPITAGLWKRIHFDHHQDPNRMDVLFGSPLNTVPTIVIILLPLGWLLGAGAGGAAAALCVGFVITCIYEFIHCIQHLNFKPRNRLLRRMKELHLIHHYQDETGNFGITSFTVDRVLGTYFSEARERPRSPHVFNLGYDLEEAKRFPWVAELTGHMPRERPLRAGETDQA